MFADESKFPQTADNKSETEQLTFWILIMTPESGKLTNEVNKIWGFKAKLTTPRAHMPQKVLKKYMLTVFSPF